MALFVSAGFPFAGSHKHKCPYFRSEFGISAPPESGRDAVVVVGIVVIDVARRVDVQSIVIVIAIGRTEPPIIGRPGAHIVCAGMIRTHPVYAEIMTQVSYKKQ